MCELLGMSANVPTDICFSFSGLMQRGGETGPHSDGWGIAFYEGKGLRSFHDPDPSCTSIIAQFVKSHPIKSTLVVSHIRQANVGQVNLENTHPFSRELWGYIWSYAHNGQLEVSLFDWPLEYYLPVGTTDSEYAFCWLMDQLRKKFKTRPLDSAVLSEFIHQCCEKLRTLGVFNMLLGDSNLLFTYNTTKLWWITRQAPFGAATLKDCDLTVDFQNETSVTDKVTVIATQPLTEQEQWHKIETGELITFELAEIINRRTTAQKIAT